MDGGGRQQGDSDRKVFVSNLPWEIDWQELKSTFRRAGNVTYAHVIKDAQNGKSKGCGIVEFEHAAEAQAAIDMFEGSEMGGRTVHVRQDIQDAGQRQQAIAAKRAATDSIQGGSGGGGGGGGGKRSRVDYEGGYSRGSDGYDRQAPGMVGDYNQGGAVGRGNISGAGLDAGMGMGMGMARRNRAAAAGMYGDMYGGGMGQAGMGGGMGGVMGGGMGGGMAGMVPGGMMGPAMAAGMAGLAGMQAMAAFGGWPAGRMEAAMAGFDPGFDPEMAGGFGDMGGFGGFPGGPGGGPGFGPDGAGRRVFVTNLNFNTTWQEVKDLFKTLGNVTYVNLLKDKEGKSKGCAIVEFENPEDAMRSINVLSNTELGGRRITVREDQREGMGQGMAPGGMQAPPQDMPRGGNRGFEQKQAPPGSVSVVVHGLPFSYDWVQLKDMMKGAGTIIRAEIKRDAQGRSRGWATVLFDGEASAEKAIEEFHGTSLHGRTIQVQRDKFQPGSKGGNAPT